MTTKVFYADTKADLSGITDAVLGSVAYVIDEAAKYMMNSKGQWICQTTGGFDLSKFATMDFVDAAIAAMNPVKDIYGDAHAFGLMVDSKDNKTLVQAMLEKGKVGMYNFHIEKGCPGQPAEVVANNSSCRGICCVDTYRSDSNWYGWILMFDQTGETYVQYIRNAVPQGWRKVATTLVEA